MVLRGCVTVCIAVLYILGWTHMYASRAVWPFKKQETSRNSVEILVGQSSCKNRPRQVSNQLGEHVHVLQRLTLPTLLCTGLVSETTPISTSDPAAALDAALLWPFCVARVAALGRLPVRVNSRSCSSSSGIDAGFVSGAAAKGFLQLGAIGFRG